MNANAIFSMAYEMARNEGNTHQQAAAYAEWCLFAAMAQVAPAGSTHASHQAAHWLKEVARLEVRI